MLQKPYSTANSFVNVFFFFFLAYLKNLFLKTHPIWIIGLQRKRKILSSFNICCTCVDTFSIVIIRTNSVFILFYLSIENQGNFRYPNVVK